MLSACESRDGRTGHKISLPALVLKFLFFKGKLYLSLILTHLMNKGGVSSRKRLWKRDEARIVGASAGETPVSESEAVKAPEAACPEPSPFERRFRHLPRPRQLGFCRSRTAPWFYVSPKPVFIASVGRRCLVRKERRGLICAALLWGRWALSRSLVEPLRDSTYIGGKFAGL